MTDLVEHGRDGPPPVFSICVPQYDRTSFFVKAVASYAAQTFRDVEVCVSDGHSPDGRQAEVVAALRASGLAFVFRRSADRLRYDPNTRTAIGLARGRYCVLMGNDDALNGPDTLADVHAALAAHGWPGVVIHDACDDRTGRPTGRIRRTAVYPGEPRTAALHYRNFSFVSGVLLEREPAQALATDRWDGAEMYQTWVGCRLIAGGRPLLERAVPFSRQDLVVPGEQTDSVVRRPRVWPCPVAERPSTLTHFARLVADAIAPHAGPAAGRLNELVLVQHLGITMPFWLFQFRAVQSWQYAAGLALGVQPRRTAAGVALPAWRRARVWLVYLVATAGGLLVPRGWFDAARGTLYRLAKSIR